LKHTISEEEKLCKDRYQFEVLERVGSKDDDDSIEYSQILFYIAKEPYDDQE
jgi:hypothetical protein